MMELLLDFGNTRLKWRLTTLEAVIGRGYIDPLAFEAGLEALDWSSISLVGICSVADPLLTKAVSVCCGNLCAIGCSILEVDLEKLPQWLSLGATPKNQIGKDRVMALLGGYKKAISYGVVDAGTACTIDYVVNGEHKGGYIIPGLQMSRSILCEQTAHIALLDNNVYSSGLQPGRSTQSAVEHGVRISLIAAVDRAIKESPWPLDEVSVTGGDGEWLFKHLEGTVKLKSDLVFEGIHRFLSGL